MSLGTLFQIVTDPVTIAFLVVSFALFAYYLRKVLQVAKCNKALRCVVSEDNILEP